MSAASVPRGGGEEGVLDLHARSRRVRQRVGERDWSPERLRFDTIIDGRAQRAVDSGAPYYPAAGA
jgi:hypothetical protein